LQMHQEVTRILQIFLKKFCEFRPSGETKLYHFLRP
jgi:hypothetical protein